MLIWVAVMATASNEHFLEPPDRSSPWATLDTFFTSIDIAWDLYTFGDTGFHYPFSLPGTASI
jgi:hypothetical protein